MTKSSTRGGNSNLYGGGKGAKMTKGKSKGMIKTPATGSLVKK